LVCYHAEQDALRFYDCGLQCWEDMIWFLKGKPTSLTQLMEYGWEVIGEL
jgi:hypothetical protein